jgi:superfamily I DNA and RNA helicase
MGKGSTIDRALSGDRLHETHPDWHIALVFWTQSLYNQITELVRGAFRQQTGREPDWTHLHVLHAWGGQAREGFLSRLASRSAARRLLSITEVEARSGRSSPGDTFITVCEDLRKRAGQVPELYDAVLVDEGQDLPPVFYQLIQATLRPTKNLTIAYDEAQGIGSLVIPTWKNLGIDEAQFGARLAGFAAGGIQRSTVFKRCYRTPQKLLLAAQAVNMGLFRTGGPVQGITTAAAWRKLGYEVEGQFRRGTEVRLRRAEDTSVHPLDRDDALSKQAGELLEVQEFQSEEQEREWIAVRVRSDVSRGLKPEDILITCVRGSDEKQYFERLEQQILRLGVPVHRPDRDGPAIFRQEGRVCLSNSYRAKGNEAWKVYVARTHNTRQSSSYSQETEMHKRNEAYVAMTRTRVWCAVTGLKDPVMEEIQTAVRQYPELRFPGFDKRDLRRDLDDGEESAEG